MALTRTLGADEWQAPIEIQNAYWRLIKAAVIRDLEGNAPLNGEQDERTVKYIVRVSFAVYSTAPDIQGKGYVHSHMMDIDLSAVLASAGDNFVAQVYNAVKQEPMFAGAQDV